MLKRTIVKFAAAAVGTLGALGAAVIGGAGSAAAATNSSYGCVYSSPGHATDCFAFTKYATRLWLPNNTVLGYMPQGTEIEITCWYYSNGQTADGYWDHTVWDSYFGSVTGHVSDDAIDFGGQTPPQVGLSKC